MDGTASVPAPDLLHSKTLHSKHVARDWSTHLQDSTAADGTTRRKSNRSRLPSCHAMHGVLSTETSTHWHVASNYGTSCLHGGHCTSSVWAALHVHAETMVVTIAGCYYAGLSGTSFEMDGINTTLSHSPLNKYSFHSCTQRPWWFTKLVIITRCCTAHYLKWTV
ncbi:hypothetical protein J6590_078201 [Homalodisca vitripennis]|nr:hypothetical protein J6590_078201 [Homalodisca vitripennis]